MHPFAAAVEAHDIDRVLALCTPDAVLHSPITTRFGFSGTQLRELLGDVFAVFEDIHYTHEARAGDRIYLTRTARVGRHRTEEVQVLTLDDEGRITDITLFIRPLPALAAVAAALGPRLARRRGGAPRAALATAGLAPVAALTRLGDALAPRIVR